MENFLAYLGAFSTALRTEQRGEEPSEVERILATPIIPFNVMK